MISVGKQGSFVDENMCETNLRCLYFFTQAVHTTSNVNCIGIGIVKYEMFQCCDACISGKLSNLLNPKVFSNIANIAFTVSMCVLKNLSNMM